jgi:hypothetical protein
MPILSGNRFSCFNVRKQQIDMRNVGFIMVAAGIILMVITGFTYSTRKNVADIGPIEINKEEKHPVQWSPLLGGGLLVAGIILVVSGKKKA